MSHIFLSYSRNDNPLMLRVRDLLRTQSLTVWTDERLIPGTPSWMDAIQDAIERAACLVVILTPNAKQSRWVKEEMRYAEAQGVRIFPLLADGTEKSAVPFGFITAQHIDIRQDFDGGIARLIETVRTHIDIVNAPPTEATSAPPIIEVPASKHPRVEESKPELPPIPMQTTNAAPIEPRADALDVTKLPFKLQPSAAMLVTRTNKWWRRSAGAMELGASGDVRVIPFLRAFVDDPEIEVRLAVKRALTALRNPPPEAPPKPPPMLKKKKDAALPAEKKKSLGMQTVKLCVTGAYRSGRTTFIQNISEIDVISTTNDAAPNANLTTVAMDFGRATVDESLVIYLFGTPNAKRFDFMWEILAEGMLGFLTLVDSTRPETFLETSEIFRTFNAYAPTPFVIVANRQDQPGAFSADDLRHLFRLPGEVKVLSGSLVGANAKTFTKEATLNLLYSILEEMDDSDAPSLTTKRRLKSPFPDDETPIVPAVNVRGISHQAPILIRRTNKDDTTRIAAVLNAATDDQSWTSGNVFNTFANSAYLLALMGSIPVGAARFAVENHALTIRLFVARGMPIEPVGGRLLDAVHEIADDLLPEGAYALDFEEMRGVYESRGYTLSPLPINAKPVLTKSLRERIVKPL